MASHFILVTQQGGPRLPHPTKLRPNMCELGTEEPGCEPQALRPRALGIPLHPDSLSLSSARGTHQSSWKGHRSGGRLREYSVAGMMVAMATYHCS